jgi:hypothetical protein
MPLMSAYPAVTATFWSSTVKGCCPPLQKNRSGLPGPSENESNLHYLPNITALPCGEPAWHSGLTRDTWSDAAAYGPKYILSTDAAGFEGTRLLTKF